VVPAAGPEAAGRPPPHRGARGRSRGKFRLEGLGVA